MQLCLQLLDGAHTAHQQHCRHTHAEVSGGIEDGDVKTGSMEGGWVPLSGCGYVTGLKSDGWIELQCLSGSWTQDPRFSQESWGRILDLRSWIRARIQVQSVNPGVGIEMTQVLRLNLERRIELQSGTGSKIKDSGRKIVRESSILDPSRIEIRSFSPDFNRVT